MMNSVVVIQADNRVLDKTKKWLSALTAEARNLQKAGGSFSSPARTDTHIIEVERNLEVGDETDEDGRGDDAVLY